MEGLHCRDQTLIARRGNTVVLQVKLSSVLSSPYSVTLTFLPVHGPRERSSTFKTNGWSSNSYELWLSITLPCNFPVGKYDAHISLSLKGYTEIITHLVHCALVVLFNPWNPGEPAIVANTLAWLVCRAVIRYFEVDRPNIY